MLKRAGASAVYKHTYMDNRTALKDNIAVVGSACVQQTVLTLGASADSRFLSGATTRGCKQDLSSWSLVSSTTTEGARHVLKASTSLPLPEDCDLLVGYFHQWP